MSPSDDRRLVAGCLLGSFVGTEAPPWLLDAIRDGLGGVLLFADNVVDDAQTARLCAALRRARHDVVIAVDEEGGDVTRLDAQRGSDIPSPAAFGFVDDLGLTEAAFAALGRRVHGLGIDLTLAPCADVNSNPLNSIIGVRSFGTTAEHAARHVAAAIRGWRAGDVAVCAKHFPGHGDTSADTHLGGARLDAPMETLVRRELPPFEAAIAAGSDAILTAHIVAAALDDEPVSLSEPWTRYLRDTMGFDGVVITDALDMDGVAMGRGIGGVAAAAVRAAAAGADLLCLGSKFDEAMTTQVIDAVAAALASGRIDRAELQRSRRRIDALCRAEKPTKNDAHAPSCDAAAQVAAAAIVVDGPLPRGPFSVLQCEPRLSMASFNVAWGLAGLTSARGWPTRTIAATDALDDVCAEAIAAAGQGPLLVVVRDAGVHTWQQQVIAHCAAAHPNTVVVELGWPSVEALGPVTDGVTDGVTHVITHGAARSSARAAVDLLSKER